MASVTALIIRAPAASVPGMRLSPMPSHPSQPPLISTRHPSSHSHHPLPSPIRALSSSHSPTPLLPPPPRPTTNCQRTTPLLPSSPPPPSRPRLSPPPLLTCRATLVEDAPFVVAIATSLALSAAPLVLPSVPFLSSLASSKDKEEDAEALLKAQLGLAQGEGQGEDGEVVGESEGAFSLGELRAGVMTVMSLLPFFNWMCWVLAWVDSRDVKYLFFAAVYAAPYARGGLSLAVDGNWLPLFGIAACALHVQIDNVAVERRKVAVKLKHRKKRGQLSDQSDEGKK